MAAGGERGPTGMRVGPPGEKGQGTYHKVIVGERLVIGVGWGGIQGVIKTEPVNPEEVCGAWMKEKERNWSMQANGGLVGCGRVILTSRVAFRGRT
jgi:hypothetical protein